MSPSFNSRGLSQHHSVGRSLLDVRSSRHLDTATRAERGSKTSREDGQLIGCFEIYDVIRPLYAPPVDSSAPFHFAHADLNAANLIVDPESGEITGVIDWEMAGFRPAWLCAISRTWSDDDICRFVVEDHQHGQYGYGNDTAIETVLRQVFLAELEAHNPTLLEHHRKGVEPRAMLYNLCNEHTTNATGWIKKSSGTWLGEGPSYSTCGGGWRT